MVKLQLVTWKGVAIFLSEKCSDKVFVEGRPFDCDNECIIAYLDIMYRMQRSKSDCNSDV